TEADELRRAIKAAAAGQVQLSPKAAARLMNEVQSPPSPEDLTERETDVLVLLATGLSNKEIAYQLGIGEKTVKTHVRNILGKLGVLSRTQAALHAVRIGLVSIGDSTSVAYERSPAGPAEPAAADRVQLCHERRHRRDGGAAVPDHHLVAGA